MCVLVRTVFCIVSFMYVYSYLFCLYWCKDYCHRVTTQLQLVMMMMMMMMIIIIIIITICWLRRRQNSLEIPERQSNIHDMWDTQ